MTVPLVVRPSDARRTSRARSGVEPALNIEVLDRKKKEIAGRLVEKFREEGI